VTDAPLAASRTESSSDANASTRDGTSGSGRVDSALHYHVDFAATTIELLGGRVPENWDGQSFATALKANRAQGREYLILSQGAWSCQRAARFEDFLCIHSYHDGYHAFPDQLLFDLRNDPHEQHDLSTTKPQHVKRGLTMIEQWHEQMMRTSTSVIDPMQTVLSEGGAFHTRGQLPAYLKRLRETGRSSWADRLAAQHPAEVS
jgi:choline-sulfatase